MGYKNKWAIPDLPVNTTAARVDSEPAEFQKAYRYLLEAEKMFREASHTMSGGDLDKPCKIFREACDSGIHGVKAAIEALNNSKTRYERFTKAGFF